MNGRRLAASERGDGLIEFSVVAIVLFTCILGVMGVSEACYSYHFTSYAAREATRYAMVRGATWGSTTCATTTMAKCNATGPDVHRYVQSLVTSGISSGSPLTVVTTWSGKQLGGAATTCVNTNGSNSPGCLVAVQVKYAFGYSIPLLPTSPLAFSSTSQVVIMQ
jgi:Flp pilus assembly protein TadG